MEISKAAWKKSESLDKQIKASVEGDLGKTRSQEFQ